MGKKRPCGDGLKTLVLSITKYPQKGLEVATDGWSLNQEPAVGLAMLYVTEMEISAPLLDEIQMLLPPTFIVLLHQGGWLSMFVVDDPLSHSPVRG